MDDRNLELNMNQRPTSNILCKEGTFEDDMQLFERYGNKYYPVLLKENNNKLYIENTDTLFKGFDKEYAVIHHLFQSTKDSKIFSENYEDMYQNLALPYHHILNLPHTKENILFRQEGIKELVNNEPLYNALESILESKKMYNDASMKRYYDNMEIRCNITPEQLKDFFNSVNALAQYNPTSGPFRKLFNWTDELSKDTQFQEITREKRKVTDARIIAIYSERYKEIRYGMLKKDIKPEDVFDFLNNDLSEYNFKKKDKKGKTKIEKKTCCKL